MMPIESYESQFIDLYQMWIRKGCSATGFFELVAFAKSKSFLSSKEIFDFEAGVELPARLSSSLQNGVGTISGFVESTEVIPGSLVEIAKPITLFNEPVPNEFFEGAFRAPAGQVHRARNVSVWLGLWQRTFLSDGQIVSELTNGAGRNSAATLLKMDPVMLPGKTLVLYTEGANLFSHWLFDLLPKFEVLEKYGLTLASIDRVIINDVSKRFQLESLALLGVPLEKILIPNESARFFHLEEAITVSDVRRNFVGSPWVYQAVKRIFCSSQDLSQQAVKIYLSRSKAQRRRVINEDELISALYARGYSIIWAEDLSVATLASIMRSSGTIVSLHGAGIANAVFSDNGTRILEIYGKHISPEYGANSSICGFKHWLLAACDRNGLKPWDAMKGRNFHEENSEDVYVELNHFERALDEIELH